MGLPIHVFNRWLHSYEEDMGGVKAYRPENYPFPPSRGRTGFEISQDGSYIHIGIAPTDGASELSGKWIFRAENNIEVHLEGKHMYTLEIVSSQEDLLRVNFNYIT